jgi:hypothetical protein
MDRNSLFPLTAVGAGIADPLCSMCLFHDKLSLLGWLLLSLEILPLKGGESLEAYRLCLDGFLPSVSGLWLAYDTFL